MSKVYSVFVQQVRECIYPLMVKKLIRDEASSQPPLLADEL